MADNLQARIESIGNKAKLLTEMYAVLRKEKQSADNRIDELNAIVERQQKEIERLTTEVEYLKIASTLVPDRADVENSRAILSKLVREIDKCIQDLKE